MVPANRFGKTFVTSVKHLWKCFYKIGMNADPHVLKNANYRTLNLAAHSEQARIGAQFIKQILRSNFTYWYDGIWRVNECKIGFFLPEDGIVESPNYVFSFQNNSKYMSR